MVLTAIAICFSPSGVRSCCAQEFGNLGDPVFVPLPADSMQSVTPNHDNHSTVGPIESIFRESPARPVNFEEPIAELPNPNTSAQESFVELGTWLEQVKVGYDGGFTIISKDKVDLGGSNDNFRLKLNGWGQLRNTLLESSRGSRDIRQFQLKRARLVFSGSAFTPDFKYFVQIDGRSSDGDDLRLLDYYLSYDVGHHFLDMEENTLGFRTGRWKMPFTLARYLSGREFEFSDRSVASTFFDVNRSLAWGLYGESNAFAKPVDWELAIFNGLVTGGAETGSSGTLDSNFAYSARVFSVIQGDWGRGQLADFDYHETLAARVGIGAATSTIERVGRTEFNRVRVVDSGERLSDILPASVDSYRVFLYSADCSFKYQGWSLTNEYYFRTIDRFRGAAISQLLDHGHWLQLGKFVIPEKCQILARWSRVDGGSGTLGGGDQSSDEVGGAVVYYFRNQNSKITFDATRINGAPVSSAALDLEPGNRGWLFRTQIQFAF